MLNLPITGMPQGPGGNLEKEFFHIAFPVRNTQTTQHKSKIWPAERNSANEKLIVVSRTCKRWSSLLRSAHRCDQGSNGLERHRMMYKYANKLFTPH